jgi:hypothetical protein
MLRCTINMATSAISAHLSSWNPKYRKASNFLLYQGIVLPATLSRGVVNRVSRLPRSVQGGCIFSFVVGISYLTRYGSEKNWRRSLRSLAVSGSAGATVSFLFTMFSIGWCLWILGREGA